MDSTPQMPGQLPPEAIQYALQFFNAVREGDIDTLRAPSEAGLPANLTNENGDTLLMLASYHGHAPLVSLLLSHGADPNRLNDKGQSPLAGAVYKNERAVIEALLEGGANPHLGQPTAWQTAKMFRNEEWEKRFEEVARTREAYVGDAGAGEGSRGEGD